MHFVALQCFFDHFNPIPPTRFKSIRNVTNAFSAFSARSKDYVIPKKMFHSLCPVSVRLLLARQGLARSQMQDWMHLHWNLLIVITSVQTETDNIYWMIPLLEVTFPFSEVIVRKWDLLKLSKTTQITVYYSWSYWEVLTVRSSWLSFDADICCSRSQLILERDSLYMGHQQILKILLDALRFCLEVGIRCQNWLPYTMTETKEHHQQSS